MKKRTVNILLFLALPMCAMQLMAQQKDKKAPAHKQGAQAAGAAAPSGKPGPFHPGVYLGGSTYTGGAISSKAFDSLLRQGINAHDSIGRQFNVEGFDFTYAERSIYEDSIGNMHVMYDVSSQYCKGDKLSDDIAASIYDRIKSGDTVFIEHVSLLKKQIPGKPSHLDSMSVLGKSLKCVIVK